jgi:uncharacterized BrkB/YihY/UPF0761 family membrane protein
MVGFGSVFEITVFVIHVLYIALAIGILREEPLILSVIDYWIKVFVGLFLLYRFNPYVHIKFTDFDRKVIFSAGMFMIITTVVNTYLINYVKKAKDLGKFAYDRVKTEFARGNPEEQK